MKKKNSLLAHSFIITISVFSVLGCLTGGIGGLAPLSVRTAAQSDGDFVYVANGGDNTVSMYMVNPGTGTLTPLGGNDNTVPAGGGPQAVTVAPVGGSSPFAITARPVFVVNENTNTVSVYTVNQGTGQLNPVGQPVPTGNGPMAIAVDPQGDMAVVANMGSDTVTVYSVSPANGALTQMQTLPAGQDPTAVTVHPTGNFVYVANEGSNNISTYTVNQNSGMLTPMNPAPMPVGTMGPSSVDVLPSGNVAVATSPMTNNMAVFLVNQNPNPIVPPLIALPTPVPTGGNGPTSIDIGPDGVAAVALTSSGTSKTAQGFGAVALFRILPGGGLTPLGIVPTVGGSGPANVAVDPGGRFAYVSHQNSNNVSVVSIMPGSQQFVTTVPAGRSPRGVAIAP